VKTAEHIVLAATGRVVFERIAETMIAIPGRAAEAAPPITHAAGCSVIAALWGTFGWPPFRVELTSHRLLEDGLHLITRYREPQSR
jgi:hypothetical protein